MSMQLRNENYNCFGKIHYVPVYCCGLFWISMVAEVVFKNMNICMAKCVPKEIMLQLLITFDSAKRLTLIYGRGSANIN